MVFQPKNAPSTRIGTYILEQRKGKEETMGITEICNHRKQLLPWYWGKRRKWLVFVQLKSLGVVLHGFALQTPGGRAWLENLE